MYNIIRYTQYMGGGEEMSSTVVSKNIISYGYTLDWWFDKINIKICNVKQK